MKQFTGYQRGINLGGWLSQCRQSRQHYDSFITENDIRRISSWGLDHVRLPVDYELIQTDHGEFIEEGFQYIDNCLEWCGKYGLNMILDLHKTRGYSFDEFKSAGFFQNTNLQDNFVSLWETFSTRYEKYSDRLAFELLNEVVDRRVARIWNGIADRAITVIRNYAPTIPILMGGVENNSIASLKMLAKPRDEHIVYNFHYYEPLIFTHQSAYWIGEMPSDFSTPYPNQISGYRSQSRRCLPTRNLQVYSDLDPDAEIDSKFFESAFAEAVHIAEERDTALYCGEYGVIDQADVASTLRWYTDIHSAFRKYNIASAAWTYKGKDFGITDEHYAPILDDLIKLLS